MRRSDPKELIWWANSLEKMRALPSDARKDFGHNLHLVQQGATPQHFDHLPTLGAGVLEIKVDHDAETYRAFYVAKFPEAVYVLDVLHKKSKKQSALPRPDQERIRQRYKEVLEWRNSL